jgi:DNA modification methylase
VTSRYELFVGEVGESLRSLRTQSVRCVVTSPPYFGLRDYGHEGQIGLEETPQDFVARLVEVFAEVHRVLRDDGTLWLNIGDSYATSPRGNKLGDVSTSSLTNPRRQDTVGRGRTDTAKASGLRSKNLLGIPWRLAFALQEDGWFLRQDIIWHKPNPMPESVKDRCTKAHEYLFLLTKKPKYYFDADAIKEPASCSRTRGPALHGDTVSTNGNAGLAQRKPKPHRNKRDVWTLPTRPYKGAHFAVFPETLVEPCILAGSAPGDVVLDPFAGSGTTGVVALRHGRAFVGCELNPDYAALARKRISDSGAAW